MNKKTILFGTICFVIGMISSGFAFEYYNTVYGTTLYTIPVVIDQELANNLENLPEVVGVYIQNEWTEVEVQGGFEGQIQTYLEGIITYYELKGNLAKFNKQSDQAFGNYTTTCWYDRGTGNKVAMGIENGVWVHVSEEDILCN